MTSNAIMDETKNTDREEQQKRRTPIKNMRRLPHRSAILLTGIIVIVETMRNVSMTQLRAISLAPYAVPMSGRAVVRALLVNGLMNETIIMRIKILFS